MKKQYPKSALANDILGESPSEADKRQHIHYPLVDIDVSETDKDEKITKLSNGNGFGKIMQASFIRPPKNCKDVPENWLIFEILTIAKYRIDLASFRLAWLTF